MDETRSSERSSRAKHACRCRCCAGRRAHGQASCPCSGAISALARSRHHSPHAALAMVDVRRQAGGGRGRGGSKECSGELGLARQPTARRR